VTLERLERKVAAVTGGGSGLGEAICRRLAAAGARVAVLDVNDEAAERTADAVGGAGIRADVTDSASVDAALATAEAELGPVDIWVNNAGIAAVAHAQRVNPRAEQQVVEARAAREITTPLEGLVRLPDDEWRTMLSVHLDGTFYGTRAAARSMAPRGGGVIVNISSICGIEGCTGFPHYSAAKAGVLGFTRSVAKELIVQGIRVNAVAPGFIETPTAPIHGDVMREQRRLSVTAGRFASSDEVAGTVVFLASEDGAFYVGETLSPNGGLVTV
jgi:3-oxoacyl-[acyl-carrier protein] reductase